MSKKPNRKPNRKSSQNVSLITVPNRSQAEMIANLLQSEGIVSLLQPMGGLDIPGAYELGMISVKVAGEDMEKAASLLGDMEGLNSNPASNPEGEEDYGKRLGFHNSKLGKILSVLGRAGYRG